MSKYKSGAYADEKNNIRDKHLQCQGTLHMGQQWRDLAVQVLKPHCGLLKEERRFIRQERTQDSLPQVDDVEDDSFREVRVLRKLEVEQKEKLRKRARRNSEWSARTPRKQAPHATLCPLRIRKITLQWHRRAEQSTHTRRQLKSFRYLEYIDYDVVTDARSDRERTRKEWNEPGARV
ncbi:uncharacterized protein STEHIDRAFT_111659 [Stereum hirsutum FP-91666 SS1]|uniref:uncharacterized protein n=1 Tax=Stereum hirsutum (strain FP-91666) TaxID=721885 RepID=UPI00044499C8|nr:uncharacterized protein STEHIDRAFT_111659 [Stereum hirsutum FP-91666 SS1]EIM86126.1 hypothetical protein STEHIDRAFT_111659 [Stereum hirsutum FP-91666 SS1]